MSTLSGKRIKLLRITQSIMTDENVTQEKISEIIGCTPRTYRTWENGGGKPETRFLEKLADYYGVTTDYILGRTKE